MTPLPVAESFDAFSTPASLMLHQAASGDLTAHTVVNRRADAGGLAAFIKLPPAPYDACDKVTARVSSCRSCATRTMITRCRTLWPSRGSGEICRPSGDRLAGMKRSPCIRAATRRPDFILQSAALFGVARTKDQGARSSGASGRLAACGLRSSAAAAHGSSDGDRGRRESSRYCRLMEDFHQHQVEGAVSEALRLGAISFDAVKCYF